MINRIQREKAELLIRWLAFVIGIMIMSFGIALMIRANLGASPWDVLHVGMTIQFGLTVGSWSILIGIAILTISSIVMKERPKLGVLINMILMGLFIDLYLWLLPAPSNVMMQSILLIASIFVIGIGNGLYISPGLGAGPRDTLMLVLIKKLGWKIHWARGIMEVTVLIIGWLLGGPVFIGTLLFSLGIGHVVGFVLPNCQRLIQFLIERGTEYEDFDERPIRAYDHDGTCKKVR